VEKQIGILNADLPDFLVKYSGTVMSVFRITDYNINILFSYERKRYAAISWFLIYFQLFSLFFEKNVHNHHSSNDIYL
jgi:hypothetical protein